MPKYVSYDEMMEILDNKYLLPFRKDERLRGLNGIEIVRCDDCKHLYNDADTGKACELTNMGMDPEDFCSFGERSGDE